MKNYLARSAALAVPMMLFGLPSAFALPQAPHDFEGNGISCSDCHVPYAGLADPADTEGFAAAGSTNLTLVDDTKAWDADRWVGGVVTISSGANLGQFRRITASDATSLTWERALPFALEVGDAYAIGKVTYADIETQCRSCHNPTGRASDHPTVGMHALPDGSTIGCGKCHEPHNVMPNSGEGNALIRRDIRWPTARGEVDFPSAGDNRFVDGAPGFNGICETCHTQTATHRNDGSADMDHNVDTACGVCHSHESGFSDDSSELAEWQGSGHADAAAEAFVHWDEDGEISTSCARCHSEGGFRDYLGDDGSAVGVVDVAAPLGTTVGCSTCHADAAEVLTEVTFPSGVVVGNLGPEARCMTCHQGRSSTPQVDTRILDAAVPDNDTVSPDLSFQNVHYFAAGATIFGGIAQGGYQYAGQTYAGRMTHVEGFDSCVGCHNQHSLEVRVEECQACHPGVMNGEDLRDVRMFGTTDDFDGDGDVAEGMARELEGMSVLVYAALQQYATEVIGIGVVYESSAYPYWFEDDNGNGVADPEEANFGNRYSNWTARLLQGAYNFQYYTKDPGAFAHNPKYVVQLLHDSINDLNSALAAPPAFVGARADAAAFDATGAAAGYQLSGHADRDAEAFRHWDEDGEVSTSCAKCHSNGGFLDFLGEDGSAAGTVDAPAALGSTVTCETCHNATADALTETTFPSGDVVDGLGAEARCMQCHQGRSSTPQVDDYITAAAVADDDTVSGSLSFRNVHYMAAGATVAGTDARGGYEYAGQTYQGQLLHVPGYDDCLGCHDQHSLEVRVDECQACHAGVETVADLRDQRMFGSTADYDGDGDTAEGMAHELEGLSVLIYAAIQQYATEVAGAGIVYDSHSYPYWFEDDNGNGEVDPGEASFGNRYGSWTARLVKATYNYQFYKKDTGAYAHNPKYVVELLHDSINDLNGALTVPIAFTGERMDAPLPDPAAYVGSETCAQCHGEQHGGWVNSGHPYKIVPKDEVVDGTGYPAFVQENRGEEFAIDADFFEDQAGLMTIDAETFPNGWDDISYVIGGYGWKARFIGNDGYIITGNDEDKVQFNFPFNNVWGAGAYAPKDASSATYHTGEVKPYTCGGCHTTGWIPDEDAAMDGDLSDNQDGMPGIHGTWEEPGVGCEGCHGPGAAHAAAPVLMATPLDPDTACANCHIRGVIQDIDTSGGFIKHHEQSEEQINSEHEVIGCTGCHDPHQPVKFESAYLALEGEANDPNPNYVNRPGTRVVCESCHEAEATSYMDWAAEYGMMTEISCVDCHMPGATKSGHAAGTYAGDVRTHLFGIDVTADFTTDPTVSTTGTNPANPYISLDFACGGCHADLADDPGFDFYEWASSRVTGVHGGAAPVEQGYAGMAACVNCHQEYVENVAASGHPYKLVPADAIVADDAYPEYVQRSRGEEYAVDADFWQDQTVLSINEDTITNGWDDVSYVIGGYGWKARFLGLDGYIVTGSDKGTPDTADDDRVQYNPPFDPQLTSDGAYPALDATSATYHTGEQKPYTCGTCHTTGWVADTDAATDGDLSDNQDGLPGIHGTWAEPGVTCEGCHGPSDGHAGNPLSVPTSVQRASEMCGTCHTRGADWTDIDTSGGFIKHHEQYEETTASPHFGRLECVTCHDPHRPVKFADAFVAADGEAWDPVPGYANVGGIRRECEDCHQQQADGWADGVFSNFMPDVGCIDCHMPRITKSAVKPGERSGDLRTHIFAIDTSVDVDADPSLHTAGNGPVAGDANRYISIDWACGGCHAEEFGTGNDGQIFDWANTFDLSAIH